MAALIYTRPPNPVPGFTPPPSSPGTGGGGGTIGDHLAAADPHPQYLTPAEGNATYSLLGHTHTAANISDFAAAVDAQTATNRQPLDSDLTAIAALATTAYGRGFLDRADQAAARTYLALTPGTDVQAFDATLAALAGANWAANALPIGSGADTVTQVSFGPNTFPARASTGALGAAAITDFGLSLVDDATAGAARTTLGLGTAAVENTGTSGAAVPLLSTANTWSALQTLTGYGSLAGMRVQTLDGTGACPVFLGMGYRDDGNASQAFTGGVALAHNRTGAAMALNAHMGTVYFGGNHTDGAEANVAYSASISAVASGAFSSITAMPTDLVFYTGSEGRALSTANVTYGTQAFRLNASGQALHTAGTAALPGSACITDVDSGAYSGGANVYGIATAGINAVTIDASQRLIRGHTAALAQGAGSHPLQNHSLSAVGVGATTWLANVAGPAVELSHSRGAAVGTHAALLAGDQMGVLSFSGSDGTAFQGGASIQGYADGNWAVGATPGRILFAIDDASSVSTGVMDLRSNSVRIGNIGTAAAPELCSSADTDTGVHWVGGNVMSLSTGGLERLRIDSSGRTVLSQDSAAAIAVGGSGGNLLHLVAESGDATAPGVNSGRFANDASATRLIFGKSRGLTSSSFTAVSAGDEVVAVEAAGADGTDLGTRLGRLLLAVAPSPAVGANLVPGRFVVQLADGVGADTLTTIIDATATNVEFPVGLGLGGAVAAANNDVSRHLALYSTTYGLSVTGSRLNYVTAATAGHYFLTGATERMGLLSDGRLYGTALHNNAGAVTGTTNQYIASGTYTPTLTNTLNLTASTAYKCQWMRVGNLVTVSGAVAVDPIEAGVLTSLYMTLPIASALTANTDLGGVGSAVATAQEAWGILATIATDQANFQCVAVDATDHTVAFSFTYEVK